MTDLVEQIEAWGFDAVMAKHLADICEISKQAGRDEAATELAALRQRVKELEAESSDWFRTAARNQARAETAKRKLAVARAALTDILDITTDMRLVNRLAEIEKVAARAITREK